MANVKGVKLTLPNGNVFKGTKNLRVNVEHSHQWILSGGNTVIGVTSGLFADASSTSIIQTPLATGHIGAASGSRIFEFEFTRTKNSSNSWATASSGDPILEQLATFDYELSTAEASSLDPATLEWGPYSSGTSKYTDIPVIVQQAQPELDFETESSSFTCRMTLAETVDLSQDVDSSDGAASADYELSDPDGNVSTTIPIALDTLGGVVQRQGDEVAPSSLAQKNAASGSSSSPTSDPVATVPESFTLMGAFRGSDAKTLANTLKTDFLSNSDVTRVEITVPTGSSVNTPTPLTGTYSLGSDSYIDPLVPQIEGGVYGYALDLTQE